MYISWCKHTENVSVVFCTMMITECVHDQNACHVFWSCSLVNARMCNISKVYWSASQNT